VHDLTEGVTYYLLQDSNEQAAETDYLSRSERVWGKDLKVINIQTNDSCRVGGETPTHRQGQECTGGLRN